jgi:dimethylargininase
VFTRPARAAAVTAYAVWHAGGMQPVAEQHRALVRRPGPRLAEGLVTHIDRQPVDLDLAVRQWEGYVQALRDAGWDVAEVEPADDCPDAVFVEDAVVVYGDLAVLTRPGAGSRRDEVAGVEVAVRAAGYRVARIEAPGTLDGGDVLKWGGTVWVGQGGRSNVEGMRQLAAHLEPLGARVVGVPVSRVLHLKSAVTALPDGTVVGHAPLVDDPSVWQPFLPVPEESGAHVVLLGGQRLLMAADAPRSAELFRDLGYDVTEVDISELIKLEGCVTCLSVRMRG